MKFIVTLHLKTMPIPDEEMSPETWQDVVQHALKAIPGVGEIEVEREVEPEGRKGIGEQ